MSNAFRHSGGARGQVELEYGDRALRVLIRDNGRGIDSQVLQLGREAILASRACATAHKK